MSILLFSSHTLDQRKFFFISVFHLAALQCSLMMMEPYVAALVSVAREVLLFGDVSMIQD
jgi:hypothetical protein